VVEHAGERIAALVHDAAVLDDPGLIDSVALAATIALSNVQLQADMRRRVTDLENSRRRSWRPATPSAVVSSSSRYAPGSSWHVSARVTPSSRALLLIGADGSNASPIPASGERIRTYGDWQPTPG
jgi:hypothetical protein